jgi:hypothetical protein
MMMVAYLVSRVAPPPGEIQCGGRILHISFATKARTPRAHPGIRRFLRFNSPGCQKIRCPPALMYLVTTVLNFHGKTQITNRPRKPLVLCEGVRETRQFFEGFGSMWNQRFFYADNYFLLLLSTQNQCFFSTFIFFVFIKVLGNSGFLNLKFFLNFGIGRLFKNSNSRPKLV